MTDIWDMLAEEVRSFRTELPGLRVTPSVTAAEIRAHLGSRYDFAAPIPLEDVTADVVRMLREWMVQVTHPRYFGLFNPSVHASSIVAEALAAASNAQLAAWAHAPAACEIERHVLRYVQRALGLPEDGVANFTTGGSEANHSAVLAALTHRVPAFVDRGVAALPGAPVIYASTESHHSFVKIAQTCGLGRAAVRHVGVDAELRMDPAALAGAIAEDRAAGRYPLMAVGTAGTTGAGAVDPLPDIARVAREQDVWFHADAAWGGAAVLSPALRPVLAGIDVADSVTWDAHKWLSVSMGAGMFFCRHREAVERVFGVTTGYVPPNLEGTWDNYVTTMQWSRRFIGLRVFMLVAELGAEGVAAVVQGQADMGDVLRARLGDAGWRIVNRTRLPVVCFTHPAIEAGHVTAGEVARQVQQGGTAWISEVALTGDLRVLRACITSFQTTAPDVDLLVRELGQAVATTGSLR